ncbi:MAG: hypothetical protein K9L70_08115 [Thiohalocapsa sp.]|nr:hypothetical protein [Thiohalocapsa sp.]MCF7991156.1 hypothetical protein [Thiohalocapsa sp.]
MPNLNELQRLILPDLAISQEVDLYVHCFGPAAVAYESGEIRLLPGGQASFATLYGAFSIGKWRRLAGLAQLTFRLDLVGAGQILVRQWQAGHPPRLIQAQEVAADGSVEIEIRDIARLDGLLAIEYQPWQPSVIRGGAWLTADEPRRRATLGMVITTFRREQAVRQTVSRLTGQLLSDRSVRARLIVVDNGGTLCADEVSGATLLPNLNLGGSGGFARGLCFFQDAGDVSHVVFMDDDASSEIDSIRRAIHLLDYAVDERTAIVSALMFEEYPGIQLESGGAMPVDMWAPVRPGLDLRRTENVIENELPAPLDYGGWWMFFFPLQYVRNLPFPFFVRGDDVEFPRANDFRLTTLNGITSFGSDFFRKESPVNVALDRRGNLVNVLLHGSMKSAVRGVLRGVEKGYAFINRYCYDHADAMCEGIRDVLNGPASFEPLATFIDVRRKQIAGRMTQRRLSKEDAPDYPQIAPRRRNMLWHALRAALFNGHVLPRFLMIRRPAMLGTVWTSPGTEVFLRPCVLVQEGLDNKVILAERDVRRYFALLGRMLWLSLRLLLALPRLRREFRAARAHFGSRAYWDSQFNYAEPKDKAH